MWQKQDFSSADFLGEEGKQKDNAEDGGVFYEEDGGRRDEDQGKTENIAEAENRE